jgi:hypothetical protein
MTYPAATSGRVNSVRVSQPLTDGTAYAWQARAFDGLAHSDWSPVCYFVADGTAPAAPGVTSNYPAGALHPGGELAVFDFTAGGSADVVAYQYGWGWLPAPGFEVGSVGEPIWRDFFDDPGFVRAATPGGGASVRLVPPQRGYNTFTVRSFDRAGNASPPVTYEINVADTTPIVTMDPSRPGVGEPFPLTLRPHPSARTVTRYPYRVDDGPVQEITPGADGSATVVLTFATEGRHRIDEVRSYSVNGWISPPWEWSFTVTTGPAIHSDTYPENEAGGGVGITGTFQFRARLPEAVSFRYSFDDGEFLEVPASPDGTASVQWTPAEPGTHWVGVSSLSADGRRSPPEYYVFDVR